MKKQLLLFLFALIYNALCSQDLIVTNSQDSINCRISVINDGLIYFSLMKGNEEINTYLPLDRVTSSIRGFYATSEDKNVQPRKRDNARFRIAAVGGYSRRTISLPEDDSKSMRDYWRRAYNGFNYGVELNYYFNKFIGMGINYSASHFNPTGSIPEGDFKNFAPKTHIQQVIPTINFRALDRQNRGAFVGGVGIGFANYKTKFYQFNRHTLSEEGVTVGILLSAGYDIPISKVMAIYVQGSLNGGIVTSITETDEITGSSKKYSTDDPNYGVGLGRLNLSIGLRFAK